MDMLDGRKLKYLNASHQIGGWAGYKFVFYKFTIELDYSRDPTFLQWLQFAIFLQCLRKRPPWAVPSSSSSTVAAVATAVATAAVEAAAVVAATTEVEAGAEAKTAVALV